MRVVVLAVSSMESAVADGGEAVSGADFCGIGFGGT